MADVAVTHITKAKSGEKADRITALGNPVTPQGGWRWEAPRVIASIETKTNSFFVRDVESGKRYDIVVVRTEGEEPYLTTVDDGRPTDHLKGLPEYAAVQVQE